MTGEQRAVRVRRPGASPTVERCEHPDAHPGEVLVRMSYAGVNPIDGYVRAGAAGDPQRFPRVLGVEGVGTVDGAPYVVYGHGVGLSRDGTWAEWVSVPADALVPVPEGVSEVQASSAGVVGHTAIRVVEDRARVAGDDRVLVLGAAGGVGTAAVSLARAAGATVLGQVGSPAKADLVASLGAEPVVADSPQRLREALGDRSPTVALDPLGGGYTGVLVEVLAVGGRLVSYGVSAGPVVEADMRALYRKNLSVLGYGGVTQPPDAVRDSVVRALAAMAEHRMTIPVHAVLPMGDADKALIALAERIPQGKLVLDLR